MMDSKKNNEPDESQSSSPQKFSDEEILLAGDEYCHGKGKHVGVTSFDFLAGARWMEQHGSIESSSPQVSAEGVKNVLNLAQAELAAMYKRVGISGSNVLDLINDAYASIKQESSNLGEKENEVELKLYYWGRMTEKQVAGEVINALHRITDDCNVMLSPLSQSTPQDIEKEDLVASNSKVASPLATLRSSSGNSIEQKKYFPVEFAGYWQIKTQPYYDDGDNILDAEDVGEEKAKSNAELIAKLLSTSTPPIAEDLGEKEDDRMWREEYNAACKEIMSLQDQLKQAEKEIAYLQQEINSRQQTDSELSCSGKSNYCKD